MILTITRKAGFTAAVFVPAFFVSCVFHLWAECASPTVVTNDGNDTQGIETDIRGATTVEIAAGLYKQVRLAEKKLNEEFNTKLEMADNVEERLWLQKSQMSWEEHVKENPSRPTAHEDGTLRAIAGLSRELSRIETRCKAIQLSWEQFQIYETIANGFFISVEGILLPMRCGEIILKRTVDMDEYEEKNTREYHVFPVTLIPKSSIRFVMQGKMYYAAIIQWTEDMDGGTPDYCLCIWDEAGIPLLSLRLTFPCL